MPTVNELRMRINVNGGNSVQNINNVYRSLERIHNGIGRGSTDIKKLSTNVDSMNVKLTGLKSNIDALNNSFSAFERLGNVMKYAFGGATEYATMMENNAIGISGILVSMTKLDDQTLEWNKAMGISADIMAKLRIEALQTSATSKDLIETFRALLGPGLGAGMSIEEIIKFSSIGVNAVKAMGLPANQFIQELRGLEQGGIRASSSTLATALGINDTQIKEAKASSEGLFKFLEERLKGFEKSSAENTKTLTGRIAIMQEGLYSAMIEGGKDLYSSYSNWIKELADKMFVMNTNTKLLELNPKFVEGVREISKLLENASDKIQYIANGLSTNLEGISKAIIYFAEYKAVSSIVHTFTSKAYSVLENLGVFSNSGEAKFLKYKERFDEAINASQRYKAAQEEIRAINEYVSSSVNQLAEQYMALGISQEKAMAMQERVNNAKAAGKSSKEIDKILQENNYAIKMSLYDETHKQYLADKVKQQERIKSVEEKSIINQQKINAEIEKTNKKYEERLRKQDEIISKARQGEGALSVFDDNLVNSYVFARKDISDANSRANQWAGGERTVNSFTKLEEQLVQLGMSREEAEKGILSVREELLKIDNADVSAMQKLVEQKRAELLYDAEKIGRAKEQERVKAEIKKIQDEELASVEKNIQANIKLQEVENAREKRANRIKNLLEGKYTYTKKDVEGEQTFTTEQIQKFKDMDNALKEINVSLDRRNNILDRYRKLMQDGGKTDITNFEKATYNTIAQTKANIENANAVNRYSNALEQTKLNLNQLGGIVEKEKLNHHVLWADALTNLKMYSNSAGYEAGVISAALEKMNDKSIAGFTKEENRIKTLIALLKELAAGNAEVAYLISWRYFDGLIENSSVDKDEQIAKIVAEEQAKKSAIEQERTKKINALTDELAATRAKDAAQLEKETAALNKLNQGYLLSVKAIKELVPLEAKKTDAQQREILFNQTKAKVVRESGEQEIEILDRVINNVRRLSNESKISTTKQIESYEALIGILRALATGTMHFDDKAKRLILGYAKGCEELSGETLSLSRGIQILGGTISSLSMAAQFLDKDTDSNIGKMAEWGIQASITASAAMDLATAFGYIEKGLAAINDNEKVRAALKLLGLSATTGVGTVLGTTAAVGTGVILTGVGIKKHQDNVDDYGKEFIDYANKQLSYSRAREYLTFGDEEMDKILPSAKYGTEDNIRKVYESESVFYQEMVSYEAALADASAKRAEAELKARQEEEKRLKLAHEQQKAEQEIHKAEQEQRRIEREQKAVLEATESYKNLTNTIDIANGKLTNSFTQFDEMSLSARKQIDTWTKTLDGLVNKAGGLITVNKDGTKNFLRWGEITEAQYKKITEAFKQYYILSEKNKALKQKEFDVSYRLQMLQNNQASGMHGQYDFVNANRKALEEERKLLEYKKSLYEAGTKDRLEVETQLAANLKKIRDNDMYDMRTAWEAALTEISLTQVNFGEGIKSVFSSVQSAGEQLLTSTGSFMERVANFFNSITQSILENMAKMIMQGLITNAILSAFGGGSKIGVNVNAGTIPSIGKTSIGNVNPGISLFSAATGGLHSGWGIVGEQGPELVNFSNPGRVYTAEQTSKALGGGATNIKIELKNESGVQMQAETTGSKFDGENYIVGVVLKAISNNKNGMRNIIKGVATT